MANLLLLRTGVRGVHRCDINREVKGLRANARFWHSTSDGGGDDVFSTNTEGTEL